MDFGRVLIKSAENLVCYFMFTDQKNYNHLNFKKMKKASFVILLAVVALFTSSCSKDKINLSEQIIGKWETTKCLGAPTVLTNNIDVLTFVSPTKAYLSASFNSSVGLGVLWLNQQEFDVVINGKVATLTGHIDEHTTILIELEVSSIGSNEMLAKRTITKSVDGNMVNTVSQNVRYVKIQENYKQMILGTWEGRCTSGQAASDDGQIHRWEYKADGTYVYYEKDGDNWVPCSSNELNEYFVDGVTLFTRWVDNGQEYRENWDIAINGNTMEWSALRQNEDGSSVVIVFEMNKVN